MLLAVVEVVVLYPPRGLTFEPEGGEIRRKLIGLQVEHHANGLYPRLVTGYFSYLTVQGRDLV